MSECLSPYAEIPVLFCQKKSIYKKLGADVYDEQRDALTFNDDRALIAHPPCRLFCRLRGLSTAPIKEKLLAYFAVLMIRKNGGVLEHPAFSTLWAEMGLPTPGKRPDVFGGFSIDLNQHWFGHRAKKRTWLYIVGVGVNDIEYPISFSSVPCVAAPGPGRTSKTYLHSKERSATPELFAIWLLNLILKINDRRKH